MMEALAVTASDFAFEKGTPWRRYTLKFELDVLAHPGWAEY
jgi:hypothetical protein